MDGESFGKMMCVRCVKNGNYCWPSTQDNDLESDV